MFGLRSSVEPAHDSGAGFLSAAIGHTPTSLASVGSSLPHQDEASAAASSGSNSNISISSNVPFLSEGAMDPEHVAGGMRRGAGESGEPRQLNAQARTFVELNEKGLDRGRRSFQALFGSSLYGGAYIAFGAIIYVRIVWEFNFLVAALMFPAGLAFVITTGSDLLTSNMLYGILPVISGDPRRSMSQKWQNFVRLLSISLLGNFVASLVIAYAAANFEVVAPEDAIRLAVKKTSMSAGTVFVKAIGANWLVNLAVYQAAMVDNIAAKMALLWIPIAAFTAMRLEHSVANMTFLPLGYFAGASLTVYEIFTLNLIPCVCGNFVGACVFAAQWHLKVPQSHSPSLHNVKEHVHKI